MRRKSYGRRRGSSSRRIVRRRNRTRGMRKQPRPGKIGFRL